MAQGFPKIFGAFDMFSCNQFYDDDDDDDSDGDDL